MIVSLRVKPGVSLAKKAYYIFSEILNPEQIGRYQAEVQTDICEISSTI
jgi:hypothetical protein